MNGQGGASNSAAASMAFEEWVDDNVSKIFWNTHECKQVFDYFNNDAVMLQCVDYLVDKFVELGTASYTCSAVAAILANTNNESVNLNIVEKMAPLIRDKQNKQTVLACFDNAACRMSGKRATCRRRKTKRAQTDTVCFSFFSTSPNFDSRTQPSRGLLLSEPATERVECAPARPSGAVGRHKSLM